MLDLHRPFVESTAGSFESETPTVAEFAQRIAKSIAAYCWSVVVPADETNEP